MGHVYFSREIPVIPASNRNKYQNISGGKVQLGRRTDNVTAICESTVYTMWILNISQYYRPLWPVTGIALLILCCIHCV
jgi:hypothetical protein